MLGGAPLSVTARTTRKARAKAQAAQLMTGDEVMQRLQAQLDDQIARLESDRDAVDQRIARLRAVHDRMRQEITVDEDLLQGFSEASLPGQDGS